ncbi:hypothetical protein Bca101_089245 [Brassica carinata]
MHCSSSFLGHHSYPKLFCMGGDSPGSGASIRRSRGLPPILSVGILAKVMVDVRYQSFGRHLFSLHGELDRSPIVVTYAKAMGPSGSSRSMLLRSVS